MVICLLFSSFSIAGKHVLESASLILGLVNGAMLLRQYWRDRPKLIVSLEDAEDHFWSSWFMLPAGTYRGLPTRNYGFLLYLDIANAGLRKVQLQSWKLGVRTGPLRRHWMSAQNLPAVEMDLGSVLKQVPVLGQMTDIFHGDTVIDSGCSISGLAFFNLEAYGGSRYDPKLKQRAGRTRTLDVQVRVTDCFGKRWKMHFSLSEKPFIEIERRIPNINHIASLRGGIADETDASSTQDGSTLSTR